MDVTPLPLSSQSSIAELKRAADQENVAPNSSPLKQKQDAPKQRRPPTVTPKRFTRFFTPRTTRDDNNSRLSRRLRDITAQAVNRRLVDQRLFEQEFPNLRPAKRRRFSEISSSPPQSSPIKTHYSPRKPIPIFEDDESCMSEGEPDLPGLEPLFPEPIRQIKQKSSSYRLLTRSFGGFDTISRGYNGIDNCVSMLASTASYCTLPEDTFRLRPPISALAFCTSACNTNSLVGIGDEDGRVHLMDTAASKFSKPFLSFKAHKNAIMDMQFSPCDWFLATGSGDQTARIIDMHTQQVLSVLAGHKASVKQIRFRPDDIKLLTTSGRDGVVNVWDLRCSQRAVQTMQVDEKRYHDEPLPTNLTPYANMLAGPAHRAARASEQISLKSADNWPCPSSGVSITSIEHMPGSRAHLLLSASEQNASLKIFDLRVAGRNTKSDRLGFEIPLVCTAPPPSQPRNYGISALLLSTDGSRAYSVCKDSTVWVYSTQHLILGSAPESINHNRRTRVAPPEKPREGLGPLYGMRDPSMRISSFYIRAGLRKATPEHEELIAVGSQENCPVLFATDENKLRSHASAEMSPARIQRPAWFSSTTDIVEESPVPIYNGVGTALVRGHVGEVTSLAFSQGGDLVACSDDFVARCWREDAAQARELRQHGESDGRRWGCGWAEIDTEHDACE